jgi:hypothetical protein
LREERQRDAADVKVEVRERRRRNLAVVTEVADRGAVACESKVERNRVDSNAEIHAVHLVRAVERAV